MSTDERLHASIRDVWQEYRGGQDVADDSHLFDHLGASSHVAILITDKVRRVVGVDVPAQLIFENPVFADYVAAVRELQPADTP